MKRPLIARQTFGLILGLSLQYLLGIWIALFVEFPETDSPKELWQFAMSQPAIILHLVLGSLMVLGSLVLMVRAYKSGERVWKAGAGIGFGAVLLAWLAGEEFVATQSDNYSFAMAAFFVVALLAYVSTLYLAPKQP
jgi:hypothetical protein